MRSWIVSSAMLFLAALLMPDIGRAQQSAPGGFAISNGDRATARCYVVGGGNPNTPDGAVPFSGEPAPALNTPCKATFMGVEYTGCIFRSSAPGSAQTRFDLEACKKQLASLAAAKPIPPTAATPGNPATGDKPPPSGATAAQQAQLGNRFPPTPVAPGTGTTSGNELPPGKAGTAINGTTLTGTQFRALPPDAVIDIGGGKTITKAELLAQTKAKAERQNQGHQKEFQATAAAHFAEAQAKFQQQQKAELDARNAKVMAEIARVRKSQQQFESSPAYKTIEKETAAMEAQYQKASPADRAKIQARAKELHQQLQRMQASAVR